MTEDTGQEYAVPRYRDPERAARIVEARRRGELYQDIAAREGVFWTLVQRICQDAGLAVRRPTTAPPKPCAWAGCGKLLRNPSAVYCSRRCAGLAKSAKAFTPPKPCARAGCENPVKTRGAVYCSIRCHRLASPNPFGKGFYEQRRCGGATWQEIADAAPPDWRPQLSPAKRAGEARRVAQRYAGAHGLPWPLPNLAASERAERQAEREARRAEREARRAEREARRDERGMAEVREMVEHERRVLALRDALPKDRTISKEEAERFLVELYRTGMKYIHIGKRTNCSAVYVAEVVRRRAPELVRTGERTGKKKPPLGPLLDIGELRKAWRVERYRRLIVSGSRAPYFRGLCFPV